MKTSKQTIIRFSWQSLFPTLTFLAVVVGTVRGWSNWILLAIVTLLPIHFLLLPRLARVQARSLERELTRLIAQGKAPQALTMWNRALAVRFYTPPVYRWTKQAMILTAAGQFEQAEKLYVLAINHCEKGEKPIIMTNLATVKDKLGKHREAKGLRKEAVRLSPGLANLINTASQSNNPNHPPK